MIDLKGKTFDRLTVVRRVSSVGFQNKQARWLCRCVCGAKRVALSWDLRVGAVKACHACTRNPPTKMAVVRDDKQRRREEAAELRAILNADMHDRYVAKGQSLSTIAAAYEVDLTTVWRWIRRAGIESRPRGAPPGSRGEYAAKRVEAMRRVAAGEMMVAVSRDIGLGSGVISRWCKKDGVTPTKAKCGPKPRLRLIVRNPPVPKPRRPRAIDLTGQMFGAWTVLGRDPEMRRGSQACWLCRCACGTERSLRSQTLRIGHSRSCGCLSATNTARALIHRFGDLTGKTLGVLTVQRHELGGWVCLCDKGHEVQRQRRDLKDGATCPRCEDDRIAERTRDLHERYVVKGQVLKTIAAAYRVDLVTVWKWLRDAGIKRRPKGAPKGSRGEYAVKRAEAVRRVAAGEVAHYVERELGLGSGVISRWCKKDGVTVKRGRPRKVDAAALVDASLASLPSPQAVAPSLRDRVLDLHTQGVPRKTIAHDLGLSVETVGRWIADADRERITRIRAMAQRASARDARSEAERLLALPLRTGAVP